MSEVDWENYLLGTTVHHKDACLTDSIFNICRNFVPNKLISIRDKDAPWMTPELKSLILEKAKIYKRYVKKGRKAQDYQCLRESISRCRSAIYEANEEYFTKLAHSLNDPGLYYIVS